eukprot:3078455-Heterocapsa_arctica.AAC.1
MLLIAFMKPLAMVCEMALAPELLPPISFMEPMTIHEVTLAQKMLLIAFMKPLAIICEMALAP